MRRKIPTPEMLYGFHPVHEALLARRREIMEIWLLEQGKDRRRAQVTALAEEQNIKVLRVTAARLNHHLSHAMHQGIAARVGSLPLTPLKQVLPRQSPDGGIQGQGLWLLLDRIVDPHNLGAIIRTALCVGARAVVITKDRSAHPSPTVSKASAGALEHMDMVCVTNLTNAINLMKQYGVWIAGLDLQASQHLFEQNLNGQLAVVVGGEEKGIRPRVKQQCDLLLSIPQVGKVSSLNASVAAGVVLFEAFRQQQQRQ